MRSGPSDVGNAQRLEEHERDGGEVEGETDGELLVGGLVLLGVR